MIYLVDVVWWNVFNSTLNFLTEGNCDILFIAQLFTLCFFNTLNFSIIYPFHAFNFNVNIPSKLLQ